ncbi:hypothetical protein BS50DRAFT_169282 [Corynespora cassiicola Philippines]|uniref:F-box domain-containing protein n=1 Tax=Corynespora cassiicola Philippines TaxID=1448308 RepID=A0A2T2P577_CORCC|nr:hypothetical protein BS50DRAFT_169282 [Corynespora cassiicola Philippines]
MKNITTVIYSPGPHCIPIEAKLVRDLLPRGVVDHGNYNEWSIRPRIPSQHGIHHLIAAFYTANYNGVRVFRMNRPNLPHSNGRRIIGETTSISNFKFPRPNDIIAAKHFFCRLHTLTLNMSLLGARSASDNLDALSHLAFLLSSARDLQELDFHLLDWDCEPHHAYGHIIPDGQPIFSYLGLSAKWPHLQKISLEGVYATQDELQSIMRRNGKTLSEVRFGFCSLLVGHWSNLVDDVVYSSRVSTFALDHVNEAFIQGVPFHQLDEVDRSGWQYVGELKLDSANERYFVQLTLPIF